MKILETNKLVKKYNELTAVDHVSISIEQGEIYGLLGPNGAGKTTFINLLTHSIKKDQGSINLLGQEVDKNILFLKQDIGVVPQNLAIYEDLSAYENVKFFASLYGLKGRALSEGVHYALEFVGLDIKSKKASKTFSGGMKRRLNIACAIAHKPKLIFMDEPTVGIDPQSRNHILESVRRLNETGSTIIYTSHLMEEVEALCSRVAIMDHGKIISEGTISELQNIVTDKKTISIEIRDYEHFDVGSLAGLEGIVDSTIHDDILKLSCQKDADVISDVILKLKENQVSIMNIDMQGVSLETAFLSLTGRRLRD